jgi:non-ribosomal peptide synthetase component F/aryl carrier-like protein
MEELMHRLWRQVLSLDENETFDKQDSFFQLGGDSISAMKLSAAARELSVILSVDAVFKNPRLSHMALMLRAATLEEKGSPVLQPFELVSSWLDTNTLCNDISTEYPILIEAIEDVYPATPLQEAFLAIEVTDNSAYLFRYAWELPDDIDIPRFKAAWESTVQALPILRTRIVETKYQRPMQVVLRESLEWQDSGNLESYISNDRRKLATFGSPLAQYAIISNGENSKRHFVWTVHHATYDAVSLPLVLRHVKQAYFLEKPEPSTAFNSFIKYIESVKDSAVDFWRNELSNAPSVSFAHDLRPDHQLEVTSNFMCRVKFKSAARSDFTVATMLRASWAILLSRYSNSHDITFGATSNGRDVPVPGIDWIVGPTITTVPVRVKIDPDQPMDQFLKGIQSQATNTIPFQHLGLQNIKRIGQEVHAACEFQTLLIIQSPSQPAKENHEVFGKALQTFLPQAHTYPLVLEITPEKQALILQFSFDCKIISEKQIERLSGHFQQILKYFSHHDRMAPVKNIDMTTAADIQQIGRWNEPLLIQDEYCVQKCLQEALASHQDSQAIFAHDGEMSYSELDSLSSRLAQKLTYKGIGLHTNVLFSFERSSLAVVAILAIIKAGGILIPIELDCPKTILKHIIEHVDGRFIVCSASHRKLFSDSVEHILSVDATFYTIDDTPGKGFNTSQSHLQPTSNLYIIFETSLLEQPLGTIVEHRQYCTGFLERTKAMRDLATLRVLQGTLYSSSSGIREVLDTLMMGGCLCIPSDRDRLYNLGKYLNSAHVSVVELTPVLAEGISSEQAPDLQILSVTDLSSNAKLLNSWQSPVKLSTLHRFHGAPVTEFNRRHTAESTVSNNIGRPISALPWIVDTECPIRLAPLGTIGELVLEGPGIAAGYLDNAQKSEVAFYSRPPYIPHDSLPERRFFKTGELAKYNDFGEIILMNPKNAFPVSNGRKIDPSEIENRLRELIPSCSALAVDSLWSQGKDNLVAFVASGNSFGHPYGTTSTIIRFEEAIIDKSMISSLRQKLAHFVPAFMIPATFIPVDVLPVTIYGTLNRQQLRKLASTYLLEDPEKEPSLAALTTENERLMQELWSQTLGIEREKIQLEDQFTLLGGDSVASMRLVSAARARGLQLTTGDIFNNQSLRSMAAVARPLEAVISAHIPRFGLLGSHSQVCSIREAITAEYNFEDDLIEDIYPATPFQEDMLTNSLELPGLFTMRFVCSLAAFETDKFCRVWESRAAAHAILRTRIVQHDSKYYQVVLDNLVSWRSGDNLDAYLTEDAKKPVYLGGELSRVGIVREKDDATYFVWTAHHSVYDGWMCEMLMAEVEREYEQESIAEVGTDFQLFVKYTAELDVQQMSEYWLNKFKNCEPRRFCVVQEDYIPSMDGIFERHIQFDGTSRYGFTAASMMQLAWSYIVAQCSGSKDTVLELILTGRNSPVHGVQNIMAPTVATVPLRVTLDPKQSVYETLQKIESDQHEMAPYEQFGWPRIKELSATTKNVCECAAPFVVHPRPDDVVEKTWTTEMNLLDVIPIRPHAIPFQVDCHLGGDGFNAAARYDTKLFGKERVRELVDQFESVLRWIATADESAKIGQKSVNLI